MTNKQLVFIKIGGSLITDKTKPFAVNKRILKTITQEIKKVFTLRKKGLVIGHGSGSFAHTPAQRFNTIKGINKKRDLMGMSEVCDAACRLNRIVIAEFLRIGLPAVSWSPFSVFLSEDFKLKKLFIDSLKELLMLRALPVVYGDVIVDTKKGCTIFSTEKILNFLGRYLIKDNFRVERIIHCGKTSGVYDEDGKIIPLINKKNFKIYKKILSNSEGIDVTGGMKHKVEESLKTAKSGIPCLIIDGIKKGNLANAILGKKILGTRIEW